MKGTQRRVVHIKNTDNDFFEEAYLILKEDRENPSSEANLAEEANRFLLDSGGGEEKKKKRKISTIAVVGAILVEMIAVAVLAALLLIRI